MIVESLEDASDLMDHVSIEDNSQELSNAVSAIKFDSSGKGSRIVKNSREHIQAERNLRGQSEEELMLAKREIKRQRRKYGTRIITQEMQGVKKNQFVCHALQCEEDGLAARGRQKWKIELERYSRKKYQDGKEGEERN